MVAFKITRKSVFLIANIYIYIFRCTSVKRSCFVSEDVPCSLGHLKGSEHFLSPYDNTYILYLHIYIYLRAAAPAADPGRMVNEWNQIGINVLRCFALLGFPLFSYVYFYKIYLIKYFAIVRKFTHQTPSPPWAVPRRLQPECRSWAREIIHFMK